jgi:hypothetical protein
VDGFVQVARVPRTDDDGDEVEERSVEFAMAGVCCAPEGEEEEEAEAQEADRNWEDVAQGRQGGRPLRSVVLSMLKEHRLRIDRLRAFTNSTTANNNDDSLERVKAWDALRAVAADSAFYDPEARERSGETALARRIRCLCPTRDASRHVKRIGEDPAVIGAGSKGPARVGPALGVGPKGPGLGVGPPRGGPSRSMGIGTQQAIKAELGLVSTGKNKIEQMLSETVTVDNALMVIDKAPTIIDQAPMIVDATTGLIAAAGDMVTTIASDPLTLITMIDPVTLIAAPAMIPLSMLDKQLAQWQAGAAGNSMQYAGATAGRVFVGVLRVGIPLALTVAPLAMGVPVPPTALVSVIAPMIKQGVQMADAAASHYGVPTLTDRVNGAVGYLMNGAAAVPGVGLLMDGASAVTGAGRTGVGLLMDGAASVSQALVPRSQRGNGTIAAYNDYDHDHDDGGYGHEHERHVSKRAEGTNAALKEALVNLYGQFDFEQAANRPDRRSVLASGGASMPHRFFTPGVYLWHDARHPAVRGAIVVEPSRYAPDACGVCGGDNSSCYVDCAGVADGLATLDDCGNCTGGTTGLEPNTFLNECGLCGTDGIDEEGNCAEVQVRLPFSFFFPLFSLFLTDRTPHRRAAHLTKLRRPRFCSRAPRPRCGTNAARAVRRPRSTVRACAAARRWWTSATSACWAPRAASSTLPRIAPASASAIVPPLTRTPCARQSCVCVVLTHSVLRVACCAQGVHVCAGRARRVLRVRWRQLVVLRVRRRAPLGRHPRSVRRVRRRRLDLLPPAVRAGVRGGPRLRAPSAAPHPGRRRDPGRDQPPRRLHLHVRARALHRPRGDGHA